MWDSGILTSAGLTLMWGGTLCVSIPWEQFSAGSQPGCALWALLELGTAEGVPREPARCSSPLVPPPGRS